MCGIVGIWVKNSAAASELDHLEAAVSAISHRGPDHIGIKKYAKVGLGHARLSIIDLSDLANQPMTSQNGDAVLCFNGEIYNYKALRENLISKGVVFQTQSDTEVLLYHLMENGIEGVKDLNGFFSFLFYDKKNDCLYFARDKYGIKPLYLYEDDDKFVFASEVSSIFNFTIDRTIDEEALTQLFGLTYIPAPLSILKCANQILPGHYGKIDQNGLVIQKFYDLVETKPLDITYEEAKKTVRSKLEQAVLRRLEADVELGTFLSGGVDSSVVSLIAKKYKNDLKTFSVGFDIPFFDESTYANQMAGSIQSDHHSVQLTKKDFNQAFADFLNKIDEPFGDSSAFAVYLLSQYVKKHVSVCLSGDGADELFGGYRKYEAEYRIRKSNQFGKGTVRLIAGLIKGLPEGRGGKWADINRKIQKLAQGYRLSITERYWNWANFITEENRKQLLLNQVTGKKFKVPEIRDDLNTLFQADQKLVLPNDMLVKVDRMSMAHALEVRTPFLDYELVDYVNGLPASFKVNKNGRKQILIDAFKDDLPEAIYNRGKKGFEIPIYEWLSEEMKVIFQSEIFSEKYIKAQGLFNYNYIWSLQKEWDNKGFGDRIYLIWTLIIFQNWWDRHYYRNDKKD